MFAAPTQRSDWLIRLTVGLAGGLLLLFLGGQLAFAANPPLRILTGNILQVLASLGAVLLLGLAARLALRTASRGGLAWGLLAAAQAFNLLGALIWWLSGAAAAGQPMPPLGLLTYAAYYPLFIVGSSRVDLQACKLEYSIVSPK